MQTQITGAHLWPNQEKARNLSQAVKVGPFIHVAATMALDAEGRLISDVNMQMQIRQAYRNLEAVLGQFGASLAHVVSETVYVTSLEQARTVDLLSHVYRQDPPPARTLVEVAALSEPTAMIAVACIAVA